MTRMERMARLNMPLGIPDLEADSYILETLFLAGPTVVSPEGERPLDWPDLWPFAQATQAISEPWEHHALRSMSHSYLAARAAGNELLAMAPVDQDGADSGD